MRRQLFLIIALLCAVVQGAWATDYNVGSESDLRNAIVDGANITLTADIALSEKLTIGNGQTVTIDLDGHKLSRSLSANATYGMVIYVNGGTLTITDGSGTNSGSIKGGRSYNGAGILCESGSKLTINGGTFKDNDVSRTESGDHGRGGAIFMNPNTTLTITGGVFDGNSAYQGGAIYLDDKGSGDKAASATISGAEFKNCWATGDGGAIYNKGSLTVSNCSFTGNKATGVSGSGGGGLWNSSASTLSLTNSTITDNQCNGNGGGVNIHGRTTISGCTITGNSSGNNGGGLYIDASSSNVNLFDTNTVQSNSAGSNGGGIHVYSGSYIFMNGKPVITNNTGNSVTNNLYLAGSDTKIEVQGAFDSETRVGVSLETYNREFTDGYYGGGYNDDLNYQQCFIADVEGAELTLSVNGYKKELKLDASGVFYVGCSWVWNDKDDETKGGYVVKTTKLATDVNGFHIETDQTLNDGWYQFVGTHQYDKRIVINGNVKFILYDGCNIEFTKGIHINKNRTLTIYAQTGGTGKLRCTGDDGSASNGDAAIGGNNEVVGGNLVIHGGDIYAYPYHNDAAGIGGGDGNSGMQSVTIWGGTIEAQGRSSGAGIGGGNENGDAPDVTIYGGTITATGGKQGAGIGGGYICSNGEIRIYGGTVTATGGEKGPGIGSGAVGSDENEGHMENPVYIYGGTVTATSGKYGAGIGSGCGGNNNSEIKIYGGKVYATAGKYAAGIGGGAVMLNGDVGNAPEFHFDDDSDGRRAAPRREASASYRGGRGGQIYIYDGYVEAYGGAYAAGIGSASSASDGGYVYIYGGTVEVKVDTDGGEGNNDYMGWGYLSSHDHYTINDYGIVDAPRLDFDPDSEEDLGNEATPRLAPRRSHSYDAYLTLDNSLSVSYGSTRVAASKRIEVCRGTPSDDSVILTVTACDHSGCTYSIKNADQHDINCSYCSDRDAEAHNTDGTNGSCTKCGYKSGAYTLSFYEANATANGYGVATKYTMGNGVTFKLPECNNVPEGMEFVGWKKVTSSESGPTSIEVGSNETLQAAGFTITISADMNGDRYYARYQTCWTGEGTGTQSDPYLVKTKADWDYIATTVNGGYVHYDGKYFKMTDNIGTTDEPVTTMIGAYNSSDKYFAGNFNGGGHKLTVNMSSTSNGLAPFGTVSGGAIRNLVVTGSVSATKNISGLIGCINGDVNVSNCHVNTALTTSGSDDVRSGGITVYARQGNASFTRCLFSGSISGSGTSGWGGFVGWIPSTYGAKVNITNCLFKPSSVNVGSGNTFAHYNQSSSLTVTNSYYTQTCGTAQGTQGYTVESGNSEMYLYYGEIDRSEEETQSELQLHQYEIYPFDNGLLYNKKFYTGGTANVTFTPIMPTGYEASNVAATAGTLTDNNDGTYTLTMASADVTINAEKTAKTYETLTLYDGTHDPTNEETLDDNEGKTMNVTISGRTLYKDDKWNTLCLPFDMTNAQVTTLLDGNGTLKELDTETEYSGHKTGLDGTTLYLYFKDATEIEVGKPYLIKWSSGSDFTPTFTSVTINSHSPKAVESEDGKVSFVGNFDPVTLAAGEGTYYLGTNNQLYYPHEDRTMNAFRAYFHVDGSVSAIQMSFGDDETTGIVSVTNTNRTNNTNIYDLQGRKIANGQKPKAKGVYIVNGKKVVVK